MAEFERNDVKTKQNTDFKKLDMISFLQRVFSFFSVYSFFYQFIRNCIGILFQDKI